MKEDIGKWMGGVVLLFIIIMVSEIIFASPGTIRVTVVDIVTNNTINDTVVNVSLINCSSGIVLATNTTVNGIALFNVGAGWNYSVQLNTTGISNYLNRTDTKCYTESDGDILEELYLKGIVSINVTVSDSQNGRPVPNANISVWPANAPSYNYWNDFNLQQNYRCANGCKTNSNGNILIFTGSSEQTSTNYTISIISEQYENKNVSADTSSLNQGENLNIASEIRGRGSISGYIKDKNNNQLVSGAIVSIINYTSVGEGNPLGFDNKYFYNATSNSNGFYIIYFPTDLIGFNTVYNLKITHNRYLIKIDRNSDGTGYRGSRDINSSLTGVINVSGRVLDYSNNASLGSAQVTITELSPDSGFSYTISTNSTGEFFIQIRNMTNYTITIDKSGYFSRNYNKSGSINSMNIGNVSLIGNANITGMVIDKYTDLNGNVIPLVATVTIKQGSMTYTTTSGADGNFLLRIPSTTMYDITIGKPGYYNFTNASLVPVALENNNLSNLEIAGKMEIIGNVKDYESGKINRNLEGVNVYVNDTTNGNVYKVQTDENGNFKINISSDAVEFFMKYELDGYETLIDRLPENNISYLGTKSLENVYLVGKTWIHGYVIDAETTGNPLYLKNANLRIRYLNSDTDLYSVYTNNSGYFSVYLGVTGNYKAVVSKNGYVTAIYENGTTGYSPENDIAFEGNNYIKLNGTTVVQGTVIDALSKHPVYNARVKIYKLGENNATYEKSVNGSFYLNIDGTITYKISANAPGYPETVDNNNGNGYTSNYTGNITLTAKLQVIVKDYENQWGIYNAKVNVYHFYNITNYSKSINETKVNITVTCPGVPLLNIPVTLNKTNCLWYQSAINLCERVKNTTNGSIIFRTIAVGTYNLTINGSAVGCGVREETITITSAMTGTINNYTYNLTNTSAIIKVVDPRGLPVENVNVSSVTNSSVRCVTNQGGICTLNLIAAGEQSITTEHINYFNTSKFYNITAGVMNNLTENPIILTPHPGILTINVTNESGITLSNITIYISNSTFNTTNLTVNGVLNISNLTSFYNITINGTLQGYNYTIIYNEYIIPDNTTWINITLKENILIVTVADADGRYIENATVRLLNLSTNTTAVNGGGNNLTGTTNSTGNVLFNRMIPGTYNLTINASGFDGLYSEIINIDINLTERTIALNDTEPPEWSDIQIGNTTSKGELPAVYENETLWVSVNWTDNAVLSYIKLQVKYPSSGGWVDYKTKNLGNVKAYRWNESIENSFIDVHVGQNVSWRMIATDATGNWNESMPEQNFTIIDNTPPTVTVNITPETPTGIDPVVFNVTATDNVNVTEIKIYVNYTEVTNCTGSSATLTCSYIGGPYENGSKIYYYATAVDEEGNLGRDPVNKESISTRSATISARRGAAAVFDTSRNKIYIIGGYNGSAFLSEILEYDPASDSLTGSPKAALPYAMAYSSATYVSTTGNVSIFGGYNNTYSDDIIEFDIEQNTTGIVNTFSSTRAGTGAEFVESKAKIYVFGGFDGDNYTNQTVELDDETLVPSVLENDNLTTPRFLVATAYDNRINKHNVYIFGGYYNGSDLNDILKFHAEDVAGSRMSVMSATLPNATRSASAVYYPPTKKIYIFGGCNGGDWNSPVYSFNTILEYNATADNISYTSTTLPTGRCMASAVYNPVNNSILIFGGFDGSTYYTTILEYIPVTSKNFIVTTPSSQINLNVDVKNDTGGYIENVTVTVTGISSKKTNSYGRAWFILGAPSEYEITADGSSVGYGINSTTLNISENTDIVIVLNTTTLTANITDSGSNPVSSANVVLYDSGGNIVKDALNNDVSGTTNAQGLVTFTRLLPCTNCNLTVTKSGYNPSSNWTTVSISAGDNKTVHLDPIVDSYYIGALPEVLTLRISVTNNTGQPIDYVNVSAYEYETNTLYKSNLTNSSGIAILNVLGGSYDIVVDGEQRGYNSLNFSIRIGKLVIANGTADSMGEITFIVDGQPGISRSVPGNGYYVKIEAVGYTSYDRYGKGMLSGTYYDDVSGSNTDVHDSLRINLTGKSIIKGNVTDNYCLSQHKTEGCFWIKSATVNVRFHSGVGSGTVRYSKQTDENGTYLIHVSPYTETSDFNNPVNTTYDIEIVKSGYTTYNSKYNGYDTGITVEEGKNFTLNAQMIGDAIVSGYVYVINSSNPIINANISFINTSNNHTFYLAQTDSNGFFNTSISSLYTFTLIVSASGFVNKTPMLAFNGTKTDFVFYLYPANFGGVVFVVRDELNESVEGANITMFGPLNYYLRTDSAGEAAVIAQSYNYNITVNGTEIGYGIYNTMLSVQEGVQQTVNIILNSTRLNITLLSDAGGVVNGVVVTITGNKTTSFGTTANGSVLFRKVYLEIYNISFSGSKMEIYSYNATANVTVSSAGNITNTNFTLNETRVLLRACAPNKTIILNNTKTNQSYINATNDYGNILFGGIPYGNYTIYANDTEFYLSGCSALNNTKIEVILGEDENTTNAYNVSGNITIVFNVTDMNGNALQNINVTLFFNGSVANDPVTNQLLSTLTDSNGIAVLSRSVPSSYVNGSYRYILNGNSTGYGIWNRSLTVGLNGTNVSEALKPLSLVVYVRDTDGNVLSSGVNITVLVNGSVAKNSSGDNLIATGVTDSVAFDRMYIDNYTVVVNSTAYFNRVNQTIGIWLNGSKTVNFTLSERNLAVKLYDLRYMYETSKILATGNLSVALYNQSGIAKNTTGDNLIADTSTGTIIFTGIYDGVYKISVNGSLYQTTNKSVDTQFDNYTISIYLKRNETGYFNVTTSPGSVELVLRCASTSKDSATSTSTGNAILKVNLTECSSLLYIDGSRSGYYDNTTGPYSIAQQYYIENVSLSLVATPPSPGGPSGITTGPVVAACIEDWECDDWGPCIEGEQTRTCIDRNNCGTEKDRPDLIRVCGADISMEIDDLNMNAGSCKIVSLKVKNTGNLDLLNVKLLKYVMSECCALTSDDVIYRLVPQETKELDLQICSIRDVKKGEYYHRFTIVSDLASKTKTFKVNIVKDYVEVLLAQISDIENEIKNMALSSEDYNLIIGTLNKAREFTLKKKFSNAEMEIANANKYLKKVREAAGIELMWWWVVLPIILVGIAGAYFSISRGWILKPRYKISAPKEYPSYPVVDKKSLLLREIERISQRVASLDISKLGKKELYYYRRVKEIMGEFKRYIEMNDFKSAKKSLANLEEHLRVLEYGTSPEFEE